MYILYCIIISILLSIVYEFSGLNGLGVQNLSVSFLLFLIISVMITSPKIKYKWIITVFSFIISILAVCNTSKVAFQLAEISFFDTKLAKAAGDIAGLFLDKIPYPRIAFIFFLFAVIFFICFKYTYFYEKYKYSKEISKQNEIDEKLEKIDTVFSPIYVRFIAFALFALFFIFTTPISKAIGTSSFSTFLLSAKSMAINNYEEKYVDKGDLVSQIIKKAKKNELATVDTNDKLMKGYPFNKQTDMDVVIIQSETFFDIYAHEKNLEKNGIDIKEDITKNFRYYQENGISGLFYVPTVGGGTVNTEYEVLTGYGAKYFSKGSIVFTSMLKQPTNSLAHYMKTHMQNANTIGIHNHNADYWDRDKVYPRLGIDTFIDMTMFTKQEQDDLVGAWMSDKTIFDMSKRQLDANPDKNNFLLSVTVQNHGPFLGVKGDYVTTDGFTGEDTWELNNFVTNVKYSDEQLKIFMDYIDSRQKPTMVIFYGDHKPDPRYTIFQNSKFYQENDKQNLFNTDYFIYFNNAVKDEKLLALKGTKQDISSSAMNRYIQMLLGDDTAMSMYMYNYSKNPENYFNKDVISGVEDNIYRQISLKLINNLIEDEKFENK